MRLSVDESSFLSSIKADDIASVSQTLRQEPYFVNLQDQIGKTPLHLAVENSFVEMVRVLIANGAKIDTADNDGNFPIDLAIAQCLTSNGTYRENNIQIATLLFESGIDVNYMDNSGFSPLHHAAIMGDSEIMSFLLQKGADVNRKSLSGYTPLLWGLCANIWERDIQKHLDALEFLIQHGANIDATTNDGKSSLVVALENNPGRPQLAKLLQKYGAK